MNCQQLNSFRIAGRFYTLLLSFGWFSYSRTGEIFILQYINLYLYAVCTVLACCGLGVVNVVLRVAATFSWLSAYLYRVITPV